MKKIIHFISQYHNIGNLLPAQYIHNSLSKEHDVKSIDCRRFNEININKHDVMVVGGAGLLHKVFEDFWIWASKQNKQIIIWGIGACWLHKNTPYFMRHPVESYVDPSVIKKCKENIVLSNVRDMKTKEIYNLDASISICPTAAFLRNYYNQDGELGTGILYSNHTELISESEREEIMNFADDYTDNMIKSEPDDILLKYINARYTITSRLHGAIISNSFGKPYIAYAKDDKITEYFKLYGGGVCVNSIDELPEILQSNILEEINIEIDYDSIYSFEDLVMDYLKK